MVWIVGSLSWLIIRCAFAYLMLNKKTAGAAKLLGMLKKEVEVEREAAPRKADLF